MKRLTALLLLLAVLLSGCASPAPQQKQYTATYLTLFDTVTTITGFAESPEAFRETAQAIHDDLLEYHRLFDIYHDYEGIANLKTVNDNAGLAPVEVDGRILALLQDCRRYWEETGGAVNAAMGSVLSLWHEARTDSIDAPTRAYLPDAAALEEAAMHTDFNSVILDEAASTVYLADPMLRLDVGAIAKGWATQAAAESAPSGLLISVGGNVCATGPKTAEGTPWVVGIQAPRGEADEYLHTVYVTKGSVVTSGDYQRVYTAEGQSWHHIIDPETQYPAAYWQSVTILCEDSGLADALSTALFVLPMEEGQALLDRFGAEALWVDTSGKEYQSPGLSAMIRT